MRNTSKVVLAGILLMQWAPLQTQAAVNYILDNGTISTALNASDGTEPRDNWFGNVFTAVANGNRITRVDFGVFTTTPNSAGSVVLYHVTDPGGNPALGATRVYTQAFTPLTGDGTNAFLQQINLTTPVVFNVGDRFAVAVFIRNVIGLPPNDVYPYLLDTSGVATGTYWDRSTPNTFNLDDLSHAKRIDQELDPGGFNPGPGHLIIRATGSAGNLPPQSNPGGPYVAECAGAETTIHLDGSGSSDPEGGPLTYAWTTDCPEAGFDNPAIAKPVLTITNSAGCQVNCHVTLRVTDNAGATNSATASVTVHDTTPPTVNCPAPMVLEFVDEHGAVAEFVVSASDLCSSVILTVSPASGSVFPIGTTPVTAIALDACGNSNACSFTVTVLGAAGVKQHVLDELLALIATVTDRQDRRMLNLASIDLAASLDPALWVDQTHVDSDLGGMVFQREKQAVMKLQILLNSRKSTVSKATLQDFIDRLLRADRLLAVVAINDAVAAGGDPMQIALAMKALGRGDASAAAGKLNEGIEAYRIGWMKALQASRPIGEAEPVIKADPVAPAE